MNNPFKKGADESEELELLTLALNGDGAALERIIKLHRDFIYNVVWKMVMNPQDAEDITQDIIIKIITNLSSFKRQSRLRTWLYRIAFNHVLSLKRRAVENEIISFDMYGESLDSLGIEEYGSGAEPTPEEAMVIKDAMLGCTAGMLICLSREQRLVYILGEIFDIDSSVGSEVLEITPDNYRQRLSRARKELYAFINSKCGLVNKSNPCRCRNKTKQFIELGYVDPQNLEFNTSYITDIQEMLDLFSDDLDSAVDEGCREIYLTHPFQEKESIQERVESVIRTDSFQKAFKLQAS